MTLQDATFRLGEDLVFAHTTWSFQANEHWVVRGRNGSGKSLFADCLLGRLPLVGGTLNYHFHPGPGLPAEERIGHVSFEDRKLDLRDSVVQSRWSSIEEESLSVRDFLAYERVMSVNPFAVDENHGQQRQTFARRWRRAIALLQLEPFLDRTLITLSNGERQRVQLAHELAKPLRLLILDEPFTGIDTATRLHLRRLFEHLMRTRLRLLIIATHLEDLPRGITNLLEIDARRVTGASPFKLQTTAPAPTPIQRPKPRHPLPKTRKAPPRGGEMLIELRGVNISYDSHTVLNDLNWTVHAGESWAILGPNGSGKTTLLSLISGDHPQAYRNHVVVFGKARGTGESIWDLKQQIGSISPEFHLHFDDSLTCLEAVLSGFFETNGLFERPSRKQVIHARQWLARLGLADRAQTQLWDLSLGEQRMVLLARSLVKSPKLLILDEPCQGLDAAHSRLFLKKVALLIRARTTTVLFVTHRPEEIPPSIKRCLHLHPALASSADRG